MEGEGQTEKWRVLYAALQISTPGRPIPHTNPSLAHKVFWRRPFIKRTFFVLIFHSPPPPGKNITIIFTISLLFIDQIYCECNMQLTNKDGFPKIPQCSRIQLCAIFKNKNQIILQDSPPPPNAEDVATSLLCFVF